MPTLERLMAAEVKVAVQVESAMPLYLTKDDLNMDYWVRLYEKRNALSFSPSTSAGPYYDSGVVKNDHDHWIDDIFLNNTW
jgi:hypothetical protein